jgi:hypothetical protein
VLLLVGLGVLAVVLLARRGELREFTSAEGRFKVLIPGTPRPQNQNAAGMVLKAFAVEQWGGAYIVAFADVAIGANEPAWQTEQRLNGSRDGALRNVNATLVREGKVTLQGKYLGREMEANLPNQKGVIRARFYIVGSRMYQMMVVGTPAFTRSATADRFLDSLTLTN